MKDTTSDKIERVSRNIHPDRAYGCKKKKQKKFHCYCTMEFNATETITEYLTDG